MKPRIFAYSIDAMVGEDVEYLLSKPGSNFSRIFRDASRVKRMTTVFPSSTYPAHVSIMTGCRPGKSGLCFNTVPHVNGIGYPDWFLDSKDVKAEDFFSAAKRAGMTTGAVYWPVTGNNPNIDYEINELFFYLHEEIEPHFREYGANDEAIEVIRENLSRWPHVPSSPIAVRGAGFDDFINGCVTSLIRRDKPDFLVAHNCVLDSARHKNGVFHKNIEPALDLADEWLGEIADAMTDAGVYDETNFVVLSDHGHINYVRTSRIGALLRRGGFLSGNEEGKITDWRVRPFSHSGSAYLILKDRHDEALKKEVFDYFTALSKDGVYGFDKVYSAEEIRERYGTYGDFDFALCSDGYTAFSGNTMEPPIVPASPAGNLGGKGMHGYFPEMGPQPVFIGRGPAFRPGAEIEQAFTIDEAPTFAKIMGTALPEAEGRVLAELLNN